jgi:hypothetical protein
VTQSDVQRLLVRRAAAMNAKALRLGDPGRVTAAELAQIMLDSEGKCNYCGIDLDPMDGTFDHVLSFDQGGPNLPENIVRACFTCNRTKAATKSPEQLKEYQELRVTCPCGVIFRPRWADWIRGLGRTHSRACAGRLGGRRAS